MSNTLFNELKEQSNITVTTNGATAYKSTLNKIYDMFAYGGAYRGKSDEDCILLFKNAFEEDKNLALKCLFYLRDCRGGQGERRFFRICFKWLAENYPATALKNLENCSEFGRWDDLIYSTLDTSIFKDAIKIIEKQLKLDLTCKTPSLLAKWMPSENASSLVTKTAAIKCREALKLSHKKYRKMLSALREKINIIERLMSDNRWNEIQFDKIPSKAGLIYRNAFARRDIIAKKYENFAKDKNTKVNADTLYPYEIVKQARELSDSYRFGFYIEGKEDTVQREMLEKYWTNQKDYLNGKDCKMLCVCDTSGSMTWMGGNSTVKPIDVAISLSIYCAERIGGDFKNHYISFSSRPQFIEIEGTDFVDKVERIYETNLCDNTDLEKVFDLLKAASLKAKPEDRLDTIVVISDMQIDAMSNWRNEYQVETGMEKIRKDWEMWGLKLPRLVYWNVNASKPVVLDKDNGVSYVSGCSPVLFESILSGKTGWNLCLDKLLSDRYSKVII